MEKEEVMLNYRLLLVVPILLVICLISMIQATAADVEKINLNTASEEELVQLTGFGNEYAARIIAYREEWGPFETPEDFMQEKELGGRLLKKTWK